MTKLTTHTEITAATTERERYEQALSRLDRYARALDSQFRIPFTSIRFGLDPIIGLIPGIGDLVGLALSLYLVVEAIRIGAGPRIVARMLGNLLTEFVVGLVPVLGDAFDVLWKANDRNAALLRGYIASKLGPQRHRRPWLSYVMIGFFVLLVALLLFQIGHSLVTSGNV